MRLVPTQPPGRGSRKARDYATEIAQLRSEGYTLDAIRVALANAGVQVTISTVWREATRAKVPQPVAKSTAMSPPAPDADVATIASASPSSTAMQARPQRRKGMEVAEVFMRSQITNPLIRSKEPR